MSGPPWWGGGVFRFIRVTESFNFFWGGLKLAMWDYFGLEFSGGIVWVLIVNFFVPYI